MNKYIKIIFFTIIAISLVFLLFKNYLDYKNNIKKAIFSITKEENIDLDNTKLKNHDYKSIENKKIVWKWFFINKKWNFLTSKHILKDNWLKYFINIGNKKYDFDIIKKYKDKDIILWKIKNYENNNFIDYNPTKKINLSISDKIYTIKNNRKIYWKILGIDSEIIELRLYNLINTNLKLEPWDSWSPLFNINWVIIWVNSAINQIENTSFAQKL